MLHDPERYISEQQLFSKKDKLLVAFSGGVDSVVLAHVLHSYGFSISLAHCNFGLRGKESNADENFGRKLAKKLEVGFFSKRFETKAFAQKNDLSIQMAARQLRYNWFADLLKKEEFTYVLTAHHANDNVETVLINLVRGTGIKGLLGIPQKQHAIARPLLHSTKDDIMAYAKRNKLKYRNDSSNDDIKYKRNFLRHQVIPKLKELNPSLEHTFEQNILWFNRAGNVIKQFTAAKKNELVSEQNGKLKIDIKKLSREEHKSILLHEFLYPMGFNSTQTETLLKCIRKEQPGKLFFSDSHQALIDRHFIFIAPLSDDKKEEYTVNAFKELKELPIKIDYKIIRSVDFVNDRMVAFMDADKLQFPLTLRKWRAGDKFKPLGMDGFKKLSDFFTNQKLNRFDKKNVWLLLSGNDIAWVIGYRADNRFKVTDSTKKVIRLKLLP
jgi:tRNA(Ile)-lysidine synthase